MTKKLIWKLFFNTGFTDPTKLIGEERTKYLAFKVFEFMNSDNVEDFFGLINNNKETLNRLKSVWLKRIDESKQKILAYLESERLQATEESEIAAINEVKQLVIDYDYESDYSGVNTYKDIISKWPNILLPVPTDVNILNKLL
jgi:hypothetical protein